MATLGFTGTRSTDARKAELRNYLESADMITYLRKFDTYVTGGCVGWDALVGRFLATRFPPPIAQHIVVVPANRKQVDPWWEEFDPGLVQIVYMPNDTDYRDRNTEIVKRSDNMFYCADYPEADGRSQRSGTWMTYRISNEAKVPIDGIILNKDEE